VPSPALPLLTAAAFATGAVNAYRLPPRSMWGDVYSHVPNHFVSAGITLLVGLSLVALGRSGTTPRARRASRLAGGTWCLLSAVFVLDAVGGAIGDRSGDYAVHDVAAVLLLVGGLLLLTTSVLLVVTRGGRAPGPLRLAVLVSVPGAGALNEASSTLWLAVGLAAAAVWLGSAASAARLSARPAASARVVGAPTPA
jgi:hypothetical protein